MCSFFFFSHASTTWGSWFLNWGLNSCSLQWKQEDLITGLPGKFQKVPDFEFLFGCGLEFCFLNPSVGFGCTHFSPSLWALFVGSWSLINCDCVCVHVHTPLGLVTLLSYYLQTEMNVIRVGTASLKQPSVKWNLYEVSVQGFLKYVFSPSTCLSVITRDLWR